MMKNPYCHQFNTGDRVLILTPAGGCYDHVTGTVTAKLDNRLVPYPQGTEPVIPDFYQVHSDVPVDIGDGTLSSEDVHPARQVFPEKTALKHYWDTGRRRKG